MSACESPGTTSIRVALNLPFSAADVADYLLLPEVLADWIGEDCKLKPSVGGDVRLPMWRHSAYGSLDFDAVQSGRVVEFKWFSGPCDDKPETRTFEFVVQLDPMPQQVPTAASTADGDTTSPPSQARAPAEPIPQRIAFRLSVRTDTSSRLRIQHSGLALAEDRHASVQLWQRALRRLEHLMTQCLRNFRRERQAVIVVHGIGEQRPGQLLREFVSNVFDVNAGEMYYVKPDHVSSLFEMRMASVPRSDGKRPTTDVYELYWAHLVRDTTLAQVYGWMLRLLLSKGSKIPETLRRIVWLARVLLVVAVVIFAWLATKDVSGWLKALAGGALVALPGLLSFALKILGDQFAVNFAGDAARYLEPRAENIARRQEIREAGAKLIDALHAKRRYARIIVYAHSLGSVIAYDIISHAWARHSRTRDPVARTSSRALRALEDLLNAHSCPKSPPDIDAVQAMQFEAWNEYRRNGFQWRISDFVTVGSPLAHARWLLNLDAKTEFADLVRERSFPTSPPVVEQIPSPAPMSKRAVFTYTHAYDDPKNSRAKRSVQVPHHGGLFALTRWTNLFFPYHGLINGDPVAGPLAPCFGRWVKDIKLRDTKGFAHVRYTARAIEPEAVQQLRIALNLSMRRPLIEYASAKPPPTVGE